MKDLKEVKQEYDKIAIPQELSVRVQQEIAKAEQNRKANVVTKGKHSIAKWMTTGVAATIVLFVAGLNTSQAFAQTMSEVPLLGTLAQVFTFRSYEINTEDMAIYVDIPSIDMVSGDFSGIEESVNKEIHGFCKQYANEAIDRAMEYREAFLETGGTMEEWIDHDIRIKVWYEVKSQTNTHLSLVVMGTENWVSAYAESRYYNFDLVTGKQLTLADLLGADYAKVAEENIRSQVENLSAQTGLTYEMDTWEGVDESTKFYLDEEGNPVIVLDKYEIAPGSEGELEFVIK